MLVQTYVLKIHRHPPVLLLGKRQAERRALSRVAPDCSLDDGAGRHIKVGRHVSLRPPPISLVYIIIQQSLLV